MNAKNLQTLIGIVLFIAVATGAWLVQGNATSKPQDGKLACPIGVVCTHSYRFVAFGDWGAGTSFQKDVAGQMIALYKKAPYDVALTLGDNIYEDGDIKKFGKARFTDMYQPLIAGGVHFLASLGNHDYKGGYQAEQVKFFNMPGYYYSVRKGDIEFFALDTNKFAKSEVQQQWLKKALADSKAPWKIVFGHHPIYSSGEHGNNRDLKRTLEPILIKNKADIYLAGHDHDYERFAAFNGVYHIVSGGAGAYLRGFDKPVTGSLVRQKANHFLSFELDGATLSMQAIDKTGKVFDELKWHKQAAKPIQKPAAMPAP